MSCEEDRVALFLCGCGPNISSVVNLGEVAQALGDAPAVASVATHELLCAPDGRRWLADQLRRTRADAVAVAACSPREHLETFRQVCREVGRNPFLLAMINLREQCAWVTPDVGQATEKAIRMVRAGVRRAAALRPVEERQVDANTDVLVLGAGVAGLQAARLLADADRQVCLVERAPYVGGRAARLGDLFPEMECASCALEELLDAVLHHPKIEILTLAEVERLAGSYGQFQATIRRSPRYVDQQACFGCPECISHCEVTTPNAFDEGLSTRGAIYTPFDGALPNVPVIDPSLCLHFKDSSCDACARACPFGAIDLAQVGRLETRDVGAVIVATGADLVDLSGAQAWGAGAPGIYTTMALERMLSSAGPTKGEVVTAGGRRPTSVALVHCAGGADGARSEGCSSICCMAMAKHTRQLAEQLPGATLHEVLWERCTPGKGYREFVSRAGGEHARLRSIRLDPTDRLSVEPARRGRGVTLRFRDHRARQTRRALQVEMVVLAAPLCASLGTAALSQLLGVEWGSGEFLVEPRPKVAPYETTVEGIFVAGCAAGPKEIRASVAEGAAAAARVLSGLIPGRKLDLEPTRAEVDGERCSGCKACLPACSFGALRFDEAQGTTAVEERLCRGCGICVACCPTGAASGLTLTDEQLLAEIEGVLK